MGRASSDEVVQVKKEVQWEEQGDLNKETGRAEEGDSGGSQLVGSSLYPRGNAIDPRYLQPPFPGLKNVKSISPRPGAIATIAACASTTS